MGNEIIYNTEVLKSNLCDYNDYISVIGDVHNRFIIGAQNNLMPVAFKNYAPFTKCIKKDDGTTIDDTEDLDLVMPMNNLVKYSWNFCDTTDSLWFYSKNEATNFGANIANNNALEYKAKLLGKTVADRNLILKNAIIAVPRRSFEMPWINCKVELKLTWAKHSVLASAGVENDGVDSNNVIFTIKDTKLYVPIVKRS